MAALQASVEAVGRYSASFDGGADGASAKPRRARKPAAPAAEPRKRASGRQSTKKS